MHRPSQEHLSAPSPSHFVIWVLEEKIEVIVYANFQAVANATQETFHTRFNTVVGRGDFIWRSAGNYIDNLVCKIDLFEFHALVFGIGGVSSILPPKIP